MLQSGARDARRLDASSIFTQDLGVNTVSPANKRPLSITVIGVLFLLAGAVGLAYHATEFRTPPFPYELTGVLVVRLLAVAGGVFLLRGRNWARWLLLVWMAYHVALSAFHSASQTIVHGLLLAVIAFFLFSASAKMYFGTRQTRSANPAPSEH
jgi:hypothetical protein